MNSTTRVNRSIKENKFGFSSIEINKSLPASNLKIQDQKPTPVVAIN